MFEGEDTFNPGMWPDDMPTAATNTAAFQEAWFMLRAAQLGYAGTIEWTSMPPSTTWGRQHYSAIEPGVDGCRCDLPIICCNC